MLTGHRPDGPELGFPTHTREDVGVEKHDDGILEDIRKRFPEIPDIERMLSSPDLSPEISAQVLKGARDVERRAHTQRATLHATGQSLAAQAERERMEVKNNFGVDTMEELEAVEEQLKGAIFTHWRVLCGLLPLSALGDEADQPPSG